MLTKKLVKFYQLLRLKHRYPELILVNAPAWTAYLGFRTVSCIDKLYSQACQDQYIVRSFLHKIIQADFPAIFLDVGANDPFEHSNSLFFERHLGFRTIAVDALSELQSPWKAHRPSAHFVATAVGSQPGETSFEVVLGEGTASMFSSVKGASEKESASPRGLRTVKVETIDRILTTLNVQRIGIVSLDVEGYELEALRGIEFAKKWFGILIIENNSNDGLGSSNIRDHLESVGYVYHSRIWNMDDIFVHRSISD